jgi:hypothetical protein
MSNGKGSKLVLHGYVFYLIAALIIFFLLLSLFIPFPLSSDQLFMIALGVLGGYFIVEEVLKARKESAVGKYRLVIVVVLLTVLVIVVASLLAINIETLIAIIVIAVVDYAFLGVLKLVIRRSNKQTGKISM